MLKQARQYVALQPKKTKQIVNQFNRKFQQPADDKLTFSPINMRPTFLTTKNIPQPRRLRFLSPQNGTMLLRKSRALKTESQFKRPIAKNLNIELTTSKFSNKGM